MKIGCMKQNKKFGGDEGMGTLECEGIMDKIGTYV